MKTEKSRASRRDLDTKTRNCRDFAGRLSDERQFVRNERIRRTNGFYRRGTSRVRGISGPFEKYFSDDWTPPPFDYRLSVSTLPASARSQVRGRASQSVRCGFSQPSRARDAIQHIRNAQRDRPLSADLICASIGRLSI